MDRRAERRRTLNRDIVLGKSVEVADADGLDAVNMRRVSQDLGVVPMALYKHVANKEDLVDGMVDLLLRQLPKARPRDDWKAAVCDTLLSMRAVLVEHPWARQAIETRTRRTPTVLSYMERVTQIFLRGGFSPDLTHFVMHLLGNRIWGFSPELFTRPVGDPDSDQPRTSGEVDPKDYPGILAIAADARMRRPEAAGCDEDFEFSFALGLILDGAERLLHTEWESPRHIAASREA